MNKDEVATFGVPYHPRTRVCPGRLYFITNPGSGNPTHDLAWTGDTFGQTFMEALVTAWIGQVGTKIHWRTRSSRSRTRGGRLEGRQLLKK